jgi:hypothetical protein
LAKTLPGRTASIVPSCNEYYSPPVEAILTKYAYLK